MRPLRFLLCIVLLFYFCACSNNTNQTAVKSATNTAATSTGKRKIKNNIAIEENGLQVEQAFLVYADGKLVPETNVTGVDEPVKVRLIFSGGWKETDGKVAVGAAEKIETSEGDVVLDEKDLFSNISSVTAEDAKAISLTANISRLDKLYDYFLISFRVWDKNGPGEVKGPYKLYIQ